MNVLKTLKNFSFIIFIFFASLANSSNNEQDPNFKYFISGDFASSQTILNSLESFDPNWAKQIGSILNTLNLDPKYVELNEKYKNCIFDIMKNDKNELNIERFFKNSQKCVSYLEEINIHVKKLLKK